MEILLYEKLCTVKQRLLIFPTIFLLNVLLQMYPIEFEIKSIKKPTHRFITVKILFMSITLRPSSNLARTGHLLRSLFFQISRLSDTSVSFQRLFAFGRS